MGQILVAGTAVDWPNELDARMMLRRRMTRTDWIVLIVVMVLTALGYYFDVLGPPEAGGSIVSLGLLSKRGLL